MAATSKKQSTSGTVSAEEALFDYAGSLKRHVSGRRAVLVRVSRLTRYSRQPRHFRAAVEIFNPLLDSFEGQIFVLRNSDILCVLNGASISDIDSAVIKIRYMFRDDENLKAAEDAGDEDPLCRWFDIAADYEGFLAFARERFAAPDSGPAAKPETGEEKRDPPEADEDKAQEEMADRHVKQASGIVYRPIRRSREDDAKRRFTPADLEKVESALNRSSLEALIHRQNVCLLTPEGKAEPVIAEHFIPIRVVEDKLLPQCSIASDPWLLQHLRDVLDRRLFAALPGLQPGKSLAAGIRTSVSAIFSSEFRRFHKECRPRSRSKIILEFSLPDILANAAEYFRARDHVRELGYHLCIGDMDPFGFLMLNRSYLPAEFEKLRFSRDFAETTDPGLLMAFRDAVRSAGGHRVIMCACASGADVSFGQDAGINLFQGQAIDRRLAGKPSAASA